jgi:Chalcone isomerase-like
MRSKPDPRPRRQALRALATLGALAVAPALRAQEVLPPEVSSELPGARRQGNGRLRFFGLHVYDIRLWTPARALAADWATSPLALEIEYARTLYGKLIAERSLDEMRRQGEISPAQGERWLAQMTALFPDVKEGDRLTGVQVPGVAARFFVNGALKGEVRDAAFTRLFFGIWLSPRSSEPALREALLGASRSPP